jgi:hypothetical protein
MFRWKGGGHRDAREARAGAEGVEAAAVPFGKLVVWENGQVKDGFSDGFIAVCAGMMTKDPTKRKTAHALLKHPAFAQTRARCAEEARSRRGSASHQLTPSMSVMRSDASKRFHEDWCRNTGEWTAHCTALPAPY